MRNVKILSSLLLATGIFAFSHSAHAEGCEFDGPVLQCGTAGDLKSIAYEFAAGETRALLANPLDELERFPRPADREKFRVSFEKAWKAANRLDKKYQRQLRRKKMSEDDYNAWTRVYDDALESYRSAFSFYRNVLWQTKD